MNWALSLGRSAERRSRGHRGWDDDHIRGTVSAVYRTSMVEEGEEGNQMVQNKESASLIKAYLFLLVFSAATYAPNCGCTLSCAVQYLKTASNQNPTRARLPFVFLCVGFTD